MNLFRSFLLTSTALLGLASCAHQQVAEQTPAEKKELFNWDGPGIQGKAKVTIDLGEQKARIYDNGKEIAWTYVATGISGHRTPTGSFHISEKTADKHSNMWGIIVDADGNTVNHDGNSQKSTIPEGGRFVGASMPHWMRLTSGGVGMHGGPIPHPGSPASHGCIRLPYDMATKMFEELPYGTRVTIED